MKRIIAMIMMVFALTALSVVPAFATGHQGGGHGGGNNAGGGQVECQLVNGNIIQVANVQACAALGGVVVG